MELLQVQPYRIIPGIFLNDIELMHHLYNISLYFIGITIQ